VRKIVLACVLLYNLVWNSYAEKTTPVPSPVPRFSQTPPPARTNIPTATTTITATPTMNNKTIIHSPPVLPWGGESAARRQLDEPHSNNSGESARVGEHIHRPGKRRSIWHRFCTLHACPDPPADQSVRNRKRQVEFIRTGLILIGCMFKSYRSACGTEPCRMI